MRRFSAPAALWYARLSTWPGVLTLLSVLAVVLGTPVRPPDLGPRLSASNVAPALPELRAAPQPGPTAPVLGAPPTESFRPSGAGRRSGSVLTRWEAPHLRPELTVLGRRQTDGG
ncbi:hypothetical protein [Deinococcus aerophilus]|uniref:Uncharacterized protein n=1 Tax=Deinococcus aerophilus TaxID=522488 RepID=A0ABQ2GKH7_9DEIO|nr:hypothetical protein [Deinococcus aerophilus]GGL99801.1 hypothetical protein GCM10010841_05520 [Deinococcus aerophilus]